MNVIHRYVHSMHDAVEPLYYNFLAEIIGSL